MYSNYNKQLLVIKFHKYNHTIKHDLKFSFESSNIIATDFIRR